ISKMHLIEKADFLKNLPPVNGSSGTGGKDPAETAVFPRRPPHSPLVSPAQDRVHIPSVVHLVLLVQLNHLAADGKNLLRPVHGPDQLLHISRLRLGDRK